MAAGNVGPTMRLRVDNERIEPLPTDGLDVVEVVDPAGQRLFLREWQRLANHDERYPGRRPGPFDLRCRPTPG